MRTSVQASEGWRHVHGKAVNFPPHMCFSKRHWEGIFRGQSCVWVWKGCCACSMNQMPSDDMFYSNISAQGTEKGLEGAPGIIKLSSWLPPSLRLNSQYEFSDRTSYSHLPLAPQSHDTAHHMQAGCSAPLPVCESCFLTLHLLAEPLRLPCVPEKPLNDQAVLFPKLNIQLYKARPIHPIATAATSVCLAFPPTSSKTPQLQVS